MKKNYIIPAIETLPFMGTRSLCVSDPLSSDPNSGNSSTPTVGAPKKRVPSF